MHGRRGVRSGRQIRQARRPQAHRTARFSVATDFPDQPRILRGKPDALHHRTAAEFRYANDHPTDPWYQIFDSTPDHRGELIPRAVGARDTMPMARGAGSRRRRVKRRRGDLASWLRFWPKSWLRFVGAARIVAFDKRKRPSAGVRAAGTIRRNYFANTRWRCLESSARLFMLRTAKHGRAWASRPNCLSPRPVSFAVRRLAGSCTH